MVGTRKRIQDQLQVHWCGRRGMKYAVMLRTEIRNTVKSTQAQTFRIPAVPHRLPTFFFLPETMPSPSI